jgi:hypothetical protein
MVLTVVYGLPLSDHKIIDMSNHEPYKYPVFTAKQGQYLTYIYFYTKVNLRPPAEKDMQNYFGVSSASVHSMLTTLKNKNLLSSQKGVPRSFKLEISKNLLPELK